MFGRLFGSGGRGFRSRSTFHGDAVLFTTLGIISGYYIFDDTFKKYFVQPTEASSGQSVSSSTSDRAQ